jgi:hypothetical protein
MVTISQGNMMSNISVYFSSYLWLTLPKVIFTELKAIIVVHLRRGGVKHQIPAKIRKFDGCLLACKFHLRLQPSFSQLEVLFPVDPLPDPRAIVELPLTEISCVNNE